MRAPISAALRAVSLAATLSVPSAFALESSAPAPTDVPTQSQEAAAQASPEPSEEESQGTAGFAEGKGFRILSADKQYSLRVGLQAGFRTGTVLVEHEGSQPRASFFTVRPRIDGSLFKEWIRYWVSLDVASNPPFLLDAYVEAQPVDVFAVRFGQFYTPLSRHEQLGPQELLFPEWDFVADYFWPGRDKGVEFFGNTKDYGFEYAVSVTGGSPLRQFQTIPGNWMTQAMVRVSPLGKLEGTEFPYMITEGANLPFRLCLSVGGWAGRVQTAEENFNPRSGVFKAVPTGTTNEVQGGEADVTAQFGKWSLYAEGWIKRTNPLATPNSAFLATGAWGQAGLALLDKKVDFGLQAGWLDPNLSQGPDNLVFGEAQFGYYIKAPYLVIRLRYLVGNQDAPTDPAAAASLPAAPGVNQVITLQWNVYF